MKGQQVDLNSFIAIGNQIFGLFPRLMAIAYFVALVFLVARVLKSWRAPGGISTIELAAIAVAFGVAMR
jgi:hypothetical protein